MIPVNHQETAGGCFLPGVALDVGRVTSALGIKKRMLGEVMA